jgi:hypothetical protein
MNCDTKNTSQFRNSEQDLLIAIVNSKKKSQLQLPLHLGSEVAPLGTSILDA